MYQLVIWIFDGKNRNVATLHYDQQMIFDFFLIIGYLYSSNGYYLGIPYDFL
jgi:hypothetical protein